ncbi:hypothetical protein PoB_001140500 [Plakobranchus ocellatus]|uniref:Uncharacterized protein n=1 Tax=Plakobranchus ocellatus TaxID=259542 RepID=A0AAV3YQ97_9GAST|nr:hypothetical protein PoB_001140500 [Plakobranchus ocellatus]
MLAFNPSTTTVFTTSHFSALFKSASVMACASWLLFIRAVKKFPVGPSQPPMTETAMSTNALGATEFCKASHQNPHALSHCARHPSTQVLFSDSFHPQEVNTSVHMSNQQAIARGSKSDNQLNFANNFFE